jgi:hypothetical protein
MFDLCYTQVNGGVQLHPLQQEGRGEEDEFFMYGFPSIHCNP